MERVIGTIMDGEKLAIEDASIALHQTSSGGLMAYSGSFVLRPGERFFGAGDKYTLLAKDGRAGEILVERVHAGSHQPTTVFFRTSGPFVRPL
jgi:hypothetical protein